ncbi:hypothetical protein [Mannheimia varigena]|uniref:hypothetical protein n=1 Tax=Mannheimia varigena TaxID=85404 RepID=UPI0015B39637|nr:hypothetical protein [Mannheimia varigena]QLD32985.1 hypothetical protein A6B42_04035 [Mannheimia varigena]
MNNTTAQTTQRNWQEIIANLHYFSETQKDSPPNFHQPFLQTAEQLQTLIDNNGTEAEKEAFFSNVKAAYDHFKDVQELIQQAKAEAEEQAQKLREQQAKIKAENERWNNLPFYAKDGISNLICIESRQTLEDKFFAISCMFDSLKAIPQLLEMGLLEEGKSSVVERLTEMSKLYLLFADEQFSLLANEIQSGKYGKLENDTAQNKGDLC